MAKIACREHARLALLVGAALTVAACSHSQVFTRATVKARDGTFFVAQQFAQDQPFQATELPFELREDSLLTITFSAEGFITPKDANAPLMPPLLQCRLDGKPYAPGDKESQIRFKFPPLHVQMLCCDTRAFTWVVPRVSKGSHTVVIWGQIRNPELAEIAQVGDWSFVIQAFGQ
jgi:hypothetical protein